jgi:hypothetical protein
MAAYGFSGPLRDYEEDHEVPLSAGGAPADPRNLWPEPRKGRWNALDKDRTEWKLHRMLCAGEITLKRDQAVWLGNWEEDGYRRYICPAAKRSTLCP